MRPEPKQLTKAFMLRAVADYALLMTAVVFYTWAGCLHREQTVTLARARPDAALSVDPSTAGQPRAPLSGSALYHPPSEPATAAGAT